MHYEVEPNLGSGPELQTQVLVPEYDSCRQNDSPAVSVKDEVERAEQETTGVLNLTGRIADSMLQNDRKQSATNECLGIIFHTRNASAATE